MAALAQRGGVTAEIALSEGSAASLALLQLQQALAWVPSQPGRECALYTAQTLTALAASGAMILVVFWLDVCKLSKGCGTMLRLQQALPCVPSQPGRECALYTAQLLTALEACMEAAHAPQHLHGLAGRST